MNRRSLFKVQSLVAIVLCTSLSAWAKDASKATQDTSDEDDPWQVFCAASNKDIDSCKSLKAALTKDLTETNSKDRICKDASGHANDLQNTANQQLETSFNAQEAKLDQVVSVQTAAIAAQSEITQANADYQNEISAINLTLPSKVAEANSKAAQQLLGLRGQMIKLGEDIAKAEADLDAAKQAVADAQIAMQATCTDFASGKANAKLDAFDKGRNDLLGRTNVYVNYGTTTVAGAQKRRNAKRARDAQAAYMSAYSSCMSGQGDKNGGSAGPGPSLLATIQSAQNRLPLAESAYAKAMKRIEEQRQLIQQQMAQLESDKNEAVKALAALAQTQLNTAQNKLQNRITAAQAAVESSKVNLSVKGGLWDQKASTAFNLAQTANQQAMQANLQAAQACHDPGAPISTSPSTIIKSRRSSNADGKP